MISRRRAGANGDNVYEPVAPPTAAHVPGIVFERFGVDGWAMLWPVAALAVALFGFVVVYGSVMQSRLNAGLAGRAPDPVTETEQGH